LFRASSCKYIDYVLKNLAKNKQRMLLLVDRIVLAVIFLFSAYAKMKPAGGSAWSASSVRISLTMFAFQVDAYGLLSHSASIQVAKLLPPFEMFLGLWLLSGIGLRFSSLCTALLLAGFLFAIVWAYVHGLQIDCGCGDHEQVGPRKIIEDVIMLALAVGVMVGAIKLRFSRVSQAPAQI
jgi:hypothetical protein